MMAAVAPLPWARHGHAGGANTANRVTAADVRAANWTPPSATYAPEPDGDKIGVCWFVADGEGEGDDETPTWFTATVRPALEDGEGEDAQRIRARAHEAAARVGLTVEHGLSVCLLEYDAQQEDGFEAEVRPCAFVRRFNQACGVPYHILLDVAAAEEVPAEWASEAAASPATQLPPPAHAVASASRDGTLPDDLQALVASEPQPSRHKATLAMALIAQSCEDVDTDQMPPATFMWRFENGTLGGWNGVDSWTMPDGTGDPYKDLLESLASTIGGPNVRGACVAMSDLRDVIKSAITMAHKESADAVESDHINAALDQMRKRKRAE